MDKKVKKGIKVKNNKIDKKTGKSAKNNKKLYIIISIIVLSIIGGIFAYKLHLDNLEKQRILEEKLKKEQEEKLLKEIENNYSNYVITTNDTKLYKLDNDYKEVGTISKDVVVALEEQALTHETEYFKIISLDEEYYISYKDVVKAEKLEKNKRYLKYIPFDKQITTNDITNFYLDDKKIYTINKSFTFPVYIIDGDKYYVEYDNTLMYILKEDIKEINDKKNSDALKAKEIATILYHHVYNPDNGEVCATEICHTISQVQSHIDYLKQNNYFTPTMKEFEMWIDGKLNLPKKSIMITLDDGGGGENARDVFTKNEVNATLFVVAGWFDPKVFETEYFEVHSHSTNLHNQYACPGMGNQGGGILCLPKETLLQDLKTSREMTNMTTAFAYPFYDYNEYSIQVLKEAGFTMAFAGYYETGKPNMTIGGDKFRIPRFTLIYNTTTSYLDWILSTYN